MAERIQIRRDTVAQWTSVNPILLEGEIAISLDNSNLFKVGDGVTAWTGLAYQSAAAPSGVIWHDGTGAPTSGLGAQGDYYLDNNNGDYYTKVDGTTWSLRGNLTGPQGLPGTPGTPGDQGPPGDDGADGADGADGRDGEQWFTGAGSPSTEGEVGDLYLQDVTGDYYEKTADPSTWVLRGNLKGAAGTNGLDGTDGADGADGLGVPAGGTTGQVLAKVDATDNNTEWVDQSGGGGSGILQGRWTYKTSTVSGDPSSGNLRLNNSDISLATEVYISQTSDDGTDESLFFTVLEAGDRLYVQEAADGDTFITCTVGTVTDNTGWWTVAITVDSSGADTAISNNAETLVAQASEPNTDHGGLTGLTDDDHPQYLLVDGTRAMSGSIDMGGNTIVDVRSITVTGASSPSVSILDSTNGGIWIGADSDGDVQIQQRTAAGAYEDQLLWFEKNSGIIAQVDVSLNGNNLNSVDTITSTGDLTIDPSGGDVDFAGNSLSNIATINDVNALYIEGTGASVYWHDTNSGTTGQDHFIQTQDGSVIQWKARDDDWSDNGVIHELHWDGTQDFYGDVDMNSNSITNVTNLNGTAVSSLLDSGDIGSTVQGYDADTLKADTNDTLNAGFKVTDDNDGTKSSGTYTPTADGGNHKYIVNGGAFTLAPPTDSCDLVIQVTNNGSAGTITTSGFTQVVGDDLTTTNGDDFMLYVTRNNGFSVLSVVALQ